MKKMGFVCADQQTYDPKILLQVDSSPLIMSVLLTIGLGLCFLIPTSLEGNHSHIGLVIVATDAPVCMIMLLNLFREGKDSEVLEVSCQATYVCSFSAHSCNLMAVVSYG